MMLVVKPDPKQTAALVLSSAICFPIMPAHLPRKAQRLVSAGIVGNPLQSVSEKHKRHSFGSKIAGSQFAVFFFFYF